MSPTPAEILTERAKLGAEQPYRNGPHVSPMQCLAVRRARERNVGVSELCDLVGFTRSTVSKHGNELCNHPETGTVVGSEVSPEAQA